MKTFSCPTQNNDTILALGAESAGNFAIFHNRTIFHSEDFGDLLQDENFLNFKDALDNFLKKEKLLPTIVLTDLHPLYKTTILGQKLSKKFKAQHIQVQHHIAHIFSQVPIVKSELNSDSELSSDFTSGDADFYGIALDGTGHGIDGKTWGGEIFELQIMNPELRIDRIGHLENQILIGGDLAVREPARMLISILEKFLSKETVYIYVKKYYSKNQFELLWNQLQQNFNCQETSSIGRILDAISVLLGFAKNERNAKHEATYLLEKNSTEPYSNLKPKINNNILLTTPLFEYLIKNLHKDKKRLAATAQLYIAEGLYKIIIKHGANEKLQVILSGGIGKNKIISDYFSSKEILFNKKSHTHFGDAGLSVGQINYFLLANPRN